VPGGACESVYAFIDQELGLSEAEEFRLHLVKCESCHARIVDAWTIDSVARRVMGPVKKAQAAGEGFPLRWRLVPAGALAGVAAMAVAVVSNLYSASRQVDPAVYAPFAYRIAEGRLTTPDADLYRRYESPAKKATLGEGPVSPLPPLVELSKLEKRGEYLGLAAAFLQRGKAKDAMDFADQAGASARSDSDKAAIYLFQAKPDEALELADRALSKQPDLVQAKWNRALALRELEALALAARMFEEVAQQKEPGWSDEAAREAAELQQKLSRRREAFQKNADACTRMQAGGEPIPSAVAAAAPGHARECLEQVLGNKPSPERAEVLLPLALQLDALDGNPGLSDSIRRLRSAAPAQAAAPDPWSALLAVEKASAQELASGRVAVAIHRMTETLSDRCADHPAPPRPMDLRCVELRRQLAHTLSMEHKPVEARTQALQAMRLAQRIGAWEQERHLLEDLGQIARHSDSAWLVRGYLEEVLERERGATNCDIQDFAHGNLALMYQRALDFPRARHEVEVARGCRAAKTPYSTLLMVEAELARIYPPTPEETAAFQERLAALRASAPRNRSARWMADHAEGRYFLEVQPQMGEALLRRTIRDAEATPDDVAAVKARAWSYTSLILEAGKRGRYDQAFQLFVEEMGLPRAPQRCVLGVTVDDERTLTIIRDADGDVRGRYDASRKSPLKDAAGLVPPELVSALRACKSVDVMARTPLQGTPGMLPTDMAWGFLTGVSHDAPPVPPKRLVVTGAKPPSELGLEPLVPYLMPADTQAAEVLQDDAATPSRVLEAMTMATEIRIHGHGVLDGAVSDAAYVALSPDREGRFALTAGEVRKASLKGRPVVVVIACQTSRAAPYQHEPLSLPVAFIQGGARIVFAAASTIPNDEASRFFEPLLGRLRTGQNPAVALMEARATWKSNGGRSEWVDDVLMFRGEAE
jgi:hypothetical protein